MTNKHRSEHDDTVDEKGPEGTPDVVSDPARDDDEGSDWTTEGGATPAGPATRPEET